MSNEPTVTIGCPISNREKFLPYYLDNIYKLENNKENITLYFIINNSHDCSEDILLDFKQKYEHEYNQIVIDYYNGNRNAPQDKRTNEIRLKHTYHHLAKLRNKMLEFTYKKSKTDYLFSVDSDIMVYPDTLNKLLSHSKDAVAGLIFNGYTYAKNEPHKFPNILNYNENGVLTHVSNYYVKNAPYLKESKLARVDCSGAIILLSNRLCRDVKYGWDNQGEDIFFSREVYKKGYEIYVDYSAYSRHLMTEQMLEEYINQNSIISTK